LSRVYKQSQIVLGEEKIVKLQLQQVIKFDENKKNNNKLEDDQIDKQINEEAGTIIAKAKDEACIILQNAQLEYDAILNKAKEEEQQIISEAYTKSSEILESAKKEGYDEGFTRGEVAGLNEVDSIIEEAKEIKEGILLKKKTMAKSLEGEIIDLVVFCVKKVIDFEIENNHQLLLNLVKRGIEKCVYTDSLVIRVSTNDYETVNLSKNKIYIMTEGIDSIEIKKDPALNDGSIIIQTTSGTVEASLQTQIVQIEQMFHEILKGE